MITITKRFEFDAAHRVLRHESKCKHLHGHRYVADVTVTAPELDDLGRVIDFGVLKQLVGTWIDENWDHNILLHHEDPLASFAHILEAGRISGKDGTYDVADEIFAGKMPYIFPDNPTAENIAHKLYEKATELLVVHDISVLNVRVFETPTCWADYNAETPF